MDTYPHIGYGYGYGYAIIRTNVLMIAYSYQYSYPIFGYVSIMLWQIAIIKSIFSNKRGEAFIKFITLIFKIKYFKNFITIFFDCDQIIKKLKKLILNLLSDN